MKKKRFYIKPQSEAIVLEVDTPLLATSPGTGIKKEDSPNSNGQEVMIASEEDFY